MHPELMRIARQLLGSRATRRFAWARWAQLRASSILKFRGVLLTQRVEWDVPGHARMIPVEVQGPGLREVAIRVDASAVSPGTEKANFAGTAAEGSFPRMPGYSVAGSVVSVGHAVTRFAPGQRVAARAPHGNLVVVDQNRVFAVPDGVSIEDAAFIQLGIIALHGFGRAAFARGERVAVLGRGPIGQLTVQLAKALGASYVVSVAPTSRHISPSLKGYADRVIASAEEEVDLSELEADVVFESSGATAALAAAIAASRNGGRVVLLGSPRDIVTGVDLGACADRRVALIGAHIESLSDIGAYRRTGTTFLDLIAGGLISPRDLVSVEVDPAEAGRFYRDLLTRDGDWVGALLRWDRLAGPARQRAQFFRPPPRINSSFLSQPGVPRRRTAVAPPRRAVSMQKPMRFAIIGSGSRGGFHARSLAAVGGAELGAVMDVNPRLAEQLGAQLDVPWTTDYAALLGDKNIDAVFICTPHHLHADQAVAAAAAGKHLIVEKPLAHTLQDAARIVRAARECEVALSVSLNYRYTADIVTARELLAEGLLGEFTGACISHHSMKAPHYARSGSGGPDHGWRGRWSNAGGGVLLMNGIHYLDLLLHLSGVQVEEVSACYAVTQPGAEVEDNLTMWMRFANGAIATVNISSTVPGFYRNDQALTDFRMWGREGQLALRPWGKYFSSRALRGRAAEQWHPIDPAVALRDSSIEYLEDFVRAIQMGEQPPVGGDDGLRVQAVIEAAYRSAREGRPVTVEIPQL